jgi:RNA polymerase sigma factor (sigma-70 family)
LTETDHIQNLIRQALAGDAGSVRALVDRLSPVIAKRVTGTLWQRTRKRNVAQEADDIIQEVFLSLFRFDGKALRSWAPQRGMSLDRFIGMLAQHQTISILRNGRTSPWRDEPTDNDKIATMLTSTVTPETICNSREKLRLLLDRLRDNLSPRGLALFQRLIIDEEPMEQIMADTGLSREAVYQWKTRLLQTMRSLTTDLQTTPSESSAGLRIVKGGGQT